MLIVVGYKDSQLVICLCYLFYVGFSAQLKKMAVQCLITWLHVPPAMMNPITNANLVYFCTGYVQTTMKTIP